MTKNEILKEITNGATLQGSTRAGATRQLDYWQLANGSDILVTTLAYWNPSTSKPNSTVQHYYVPEYVVRIQLLTTIN